MRNLMKTVLGLAAAGVTLAGASAASAAPAADGVFFVHGTGDYCPPSSASSVSTPSGKTACGYTSSGAIDDYWTNDSLVKMSKAPDGTQWSYGVAGYQGAGTNAQTSWGVVADQLYDYYWSGNSSAIYNIVVVTHSNGSNPIRYLLAHPTAVTPKGRTASTVISVIKKVIFLAGDNQGTPLADKVTSSGTIANIGNDILSFFGGSSWNNPAVNQQIQANMTTYNGNGTFATGTAPGGVATAALYGSNVYAAVWSSDAWCGGYATTAGLKAAQIYGWGSSSAATDGFIGTGSATYVGTVPYSGDARLNHNQSRRSCHGVATNISNQIHGALGGTFAAPADYTISPAAQACDATTMWNPSLGTDTSGNSWTWKQYGCDSTQKGSTSTVWRDCYVAYGYSAAATASFSSSNVSDGYSLTDYSSKSYANIAPVSGIVEKASTTGCSDSWLGDGVCDLCLVAKYGYDSATGSTNDDDCVNAGSGGTNYCADLGATYKNGTYQWDSVVGYTVTHY